MKNWDIAQNQYGHWQVWRRQGGNHWVPDGPVFTKLEGAEQWRREAIAIRRQVRKQQRERAQS